MIHRDEKTMNISSITDFIKYLISPEETWNNSMDQHRDSMIRNSIKFLVWYVLAMTTAIGLCHLFK